MELPPQVARTASHRLKAAYLGVLLFSIVYFGRPEDWIPGAANFPFAKITGALAIAAFVLSMGARTRRLPKEMWLLIALFAQLLIAIPFSTWRGGSFDVVIYKFSKIAIITLVLVQCITTMRRLRQLISVHTLAVCVVALVSVVLAQTQSGRLTGALDGIFGNPNDLAGSITLVFPFALVFLILAKNIFSRTLWLAMIPILGYALIETFSRGGFVSMVVVVTGCLLLLARKKSTRFIFGFLTILLLVGGAVVGGKYQQRMTSIFDSSKDESGSYAARDQLLTRSIEIALAHPIFGIGPGQFPQYSNANWHAAHNSYTEFAAEAGLPAGILFTWMLVHSFIKLLRFRRREDLGREVKLFAGALAASMMGLFVTQFFSSDEYVFYPYFLVGYVSALVLVGSQGFETRPALAPISNSSLVLQPDFDS